MKKDLSKFSGVKDSSAVLPKDLNVKIGSAREALWTRVMHEAKSAIECGEESLIVQKGILELALLRIKEEQDKIHRKA